MAINVLVIYKYRLYPSGVGNTKDQFASLFIRPIKSSLETALGDKWNRPITNFTFKVKDVNGADIFSHISESDFDHFSLQRPGWGCNEFIPLPMTDEIFSNGQTTIEVNVYGVQTIKEATFMYEELVPIPHTMSFGPASCCWQLKVTEKDGWISAFLDPILSNLETCVVDAAPRIISALTVKLLDSHTKKTLISKSITGGFIFDGESAGWSQLYPSGNREVWVQCHITWDPQNFSKVTGIGKVKKALADAIIQKENDQYNFSEKLGELNAEIEALRDELSQSRPIVARYSQLEERTVQLMDELRNARSDEQQTDSLRITLASFKHRLLQIRHSMEEPVKPHVEVDPMNPDVIRLAEINAELQIKISQLVADLNYANSCIADQNLLTLTPENEEIDTKVEDKIKNARIEVDRAETAITEAQFKVISNRGDQLSLIAEISLIQSGCDVALADLHDLKIDMILANSEFDDAMLALIDVIPRLVVLRKTIEEKIFHSSKRRQSEPPPMIPSANIRTKPVIGPILGQVKEIISSPDIKVATPLVKYTESSPTHDELLDKIAELTDMVKNKDKYPSLIDAELWTPITDRNDELEAFFRNAPRQRTYGEFIMSVLSWILFMATIFVFSYSTLYVVCDPKQMSQRNNSHPFSQAHPVCYEVINPVFDAAREVWHEAALGLVDNIPYVIGVLQEDLQYAEKYFKSQYHFIRLKLEKSMEKADRILPSGTRSSSTVAVEPFIKTSPIIAPKNLEVILSKDVYGKEEVSVEKTLESNQNKAEAPITSNVKNTPEVFDSKLYSYFRSEVYFKQRDGYPKYFNLAYENQK